MAPKIKWETDYDDLLFDFIQFRSLHPNGNLSDSIKDFKNYMTKEEQPFKWSDELIKEMIYQKLPLPNHYAGNVQKCLNEFKKSKQQTSDE